MRAASSGRRALQVAASQPRPDLILLDVMMPEMDGFKVFALLRENPATRDIPVIFVTAMDGSTDEEHGLELRRRRLHHQAAAAGGRSRRVRPISNSSARATCCRPQPLSRSRGGAAHGRQPLIRTSASGAGAARRDPRPETGNHLLRAGLRC